MKYLKIIGLVILIGISIGGIYVYPKASMYFYGKKTSSIEKTTNFFVKTDAVFSEVI